MSLIGRLLNKQSLALVKQRQVSVYPLFASKSTGSAQQQMDEFWAKNRHENRPISPHLTIYSPQLTSMLSITHRATGIFLAGATVAFAEGTLLPSSVIETFLTSVDYVHANGMGYLCLLPLKFMLAWPIMFHTCNGLRHLMWDRAQGLKMNEVYRSGWIVLIASSVLALLFSLACTSK